MTTTWTDETEHGPNGTDVYDNWEWMYDDMNVMYDCVGGVMWTDEAEEVINPSP